MEPTVMAALITVTTVESISAGVTALFCIVDDTMTSEPIFEATIVSLAMRAVLSDPDEMSMILCTCLHREDIKAWV